MRKLDKKRVRSRPSGKSLQRMMVGTRLTAELRKKLDEATARSGRSMAQEIELRLERSFETQELLTNVVSLAYGEHVAGILLMVGLVMDQTGRSAAYWAMANRKHTDVPLEDIDAWPEQSFAFDQAIRGAIDVLEWARPVGRREPSALVTNSLGAGIASAFLRDLEVEKPQAGPRVLASTRYFKQDLSRLRSMLQPVLQRKKAALTEG